MCNCINVNVDSTQSGIYNHSLNLTNTFYDLFDHMYMSTGSQMKLVLQRPIQNTPYFFCIQTAFSKEGHLFDSNYGLYFSHRHTYYKLQSFTNLNYNENLGAEAGFDPPHAMTVCVDNRLTP